MYEILIREKPFSGFKLSSILIFFHKKNNTIVGLTIDDREQLKPFNEQ